MENEKQLTESESLELIQSMIYKAKDDLEDDSFHFLLWGWLVFAASISCYILVSIEYDKPWLPWMLMPLGGVASFLYGMKQEQKRKVKTYIDEVMGYVLIAFLISLCIILFSMNRLQLNTYPMVLMIYGLWLFISGGAIKFKPLIIGGIINWLIGIISFFVTFDIQLLLLAAAVLLGYIIPGYMLKSKFQKLKAV
ncbi:MAG: hypothetical protein ABI855_13615 [Bacteroidota bacterium]